MLEENNITISPETVKDDTGKTSQSEPKPSSDETVIFDEELLNADHTDYETDWSKYDLSIPEENLAEDSGRTVKDSAYYDKEIKKLKKKREQFDNHCARMRNKMKGELRKDRNARLVMWGAEFEYQIGTRSPNLKKLLPYLDRDMQKKIIWHIFAEIRTGPLIIKILKDYTRDIKDVLPDDLKPYAE